MICETSHALLATPLTSTPEVEANPEQVYALVTGMIQEDLLYLLALYLWRLPFESRKDAQVIFSYVLRFRPPTASPKSEPLALSYIINNRPEVLVELCNGYDHKESATPAGTVLREVLKSEAAAAIILYHDPSEDGTSPSKGLRGINPEIKQSGRGVFWKFFNWIDQGSFEVGADAFTTFRVITTPLEVCRALLIPCRNFSPSTRQWLLSTWRPTSTSSSITSIMSSSNRIATLRSGNRSSYLGRFS